MATINGTSASESLTGTAGDDYINGNSRSLSMAGSDTISGLVGNDVLVATVGAGDHNVVDRLDGGDGNDSLEFDLNNPGGLSSAILTGGAGDDVIALIGAGGSTLTGAMTVDGGAGTDSVAVSGDASFLTRVTFQNLEHLSLLGVDSAVLSTQQVAAVGGSISAPGTGVSPTFIFMSNGGSVDFSATTMQGLHVTLADNATTTLTATALNDSIFGGDAQSPSGSGVSYVVYAGAGDDYIGVGAPNLVGHDSLFGGAGSDTIYDVFNAAGDIIEGGTGTDSGSVELTEPGGLTLHYADFATDAGVTFADATSIRSIEHLSLNLSGAHDIVYMGDAGGAVTLSGGGTKIYAGAGDDTVSADDVYLTPGGHDSVSGFAHIDFSSASSPVRMASITQYIGRAGSSAVDEVWVGGSATSSDGSVASVTFLGRAEVFGSAFSDTLVADQHAQLSAAVDLYGGAGDDTIFAGVTGSILDGGGGRDTLDFSLIAPRSTGGGVVADLSNTGSQGLVGYTIRGFENLVGGAGADYLAGDSGANVITGGAGADSLYGGAGDDTLVPGLGGDIVYGGDGQDAVVFNFAHTLASYSHVAGQLVVTGPDGADTLVGVEHLQFADGVYAPGPDGPPVARDPGQTLQGSSVVGGSGDDVINGTSGSDTLQGGPGSDTIDGSDGVDTAVYAGRSLFYQITPQFSGIVSNGGYQSYVFTSATVGGGDEGGVDSLARVENFHFLDGVLTFDPNSTAAEIYRLYDTFLNRAPDVAGFDAFQAYLGQGHTLADAAAVAGSAPEFLAATSNLSNADFVTYLYENTVDRAPDTYGLEQYTALLNGGESRVALALQISEGQEHIQDTSAAVSAGLWAPDAPASGLALLYDTLFQREPDPYGIHAYEAEIATGTTFRQIANQAVTSAEYQARYGGTTDKQFIDALYLNTVHRAADPYGETAYLNELSHGYSRGDVIWQVSISAEHEGYVLSHPDPSLFVF